MQGHLHSAFANIRPPGHHSGPSRMDGFCFLNNVAIAAQYALDTLQAKKVLILDWDVHHGNGTQEIFENRQDVMFVSLHRYEQGRFYPVGARQHSTSGRGDYNGTGDGLGFSYNLAWDSLDSFPITDGDYQAAFDQFLVPLFTLYNPDLTLVSCGFDAMDGDPVGGMHLTPYIYAYMTRKLMERGKVVLALEGGYDVYNLEKGSEAVIRTLLGEEFEQVHYSH